METKQEEPPVYVSNHVSREGPAKREYILDGKFELDLHPFRARLLREGAIEGIFDWKGPGWEFASFRINKRRRGLMKSLTMVRDEASIHILPNGEMVLETEDEHHRFALIDRIEVWSNYAIFEISVLLGDDEFAVTDLHYKHWDIREEQFIREAAASKGRSYFEKGW